MNYKMEVPNLIVENAFLDWKKKDVDKETKSKLLKDYLKERNISENELSRELGIPKSTIHDWVSNRQNDSDRVKIIVHKKDMIFTLANRLIFLLSKQNDIDEKTQKELRNLYDTLNDRL